MRIFLALFAFAAAPLLADDATWSEEVAGEEDYLSFDISDLFGEELTCGESGLWTLDVDSASFPTVTFRHLPPGLAYDVETLTVSGAPTTPGVYEVEASAVNESGFTFRSFALVRVSNISGARISGNDTDIPFGEYFYSEIGNGDISDIFSFDETPTEVSLAGTVPGLVWNDDWQLLYGTPTEPGEYTLAATARFPTGSVERATLTLSVLGSTCEDYDLDLDLLDNLSVGDELDDSTVIGSNTSDVRISGVTGLPTGLSASSYYDEESKTRCWYVAGKVREPGLFAVTVNLDDQSGETQRVAKVWRRLTVADIPDVYLAATSADEACGTVSGGGAVSPAEDVTLIARPRSGYVFSGWYDQEGERLVLLEGVDYRQSVVQLPAGTDYQFLAPVAHFSASADDAAPDLSELEDEEFYLSADAPFEAEFAVDSLSLPTLTFKGLPAGVTCSAGGAGEYLLSYDPAGTVPSSGRYTVTATAVNRSGEKSSVRFRITVAAQVNPRINVYDDYGEFTPGEPIEPIVLSNAVDFARGETLSVSGLPKGLAYNAKANVKKGIEARTITGTPTVPGDYTLTFAAKVVSGATTNKSGKVTYRYEKAKAMSFLTVLPYPELTIEVDDDAAAAGCTVTGAGNYKAGTKVTLTAKSAKGWVFAGWEGLDDIGEFEALEPKLSYVTGEDDVWAQALFVTVDQDGLFLGEPALTTAGFAAEWQLKEALDEDASLLIADLIETVSRPTVKVTGLPSGVKFASSTFLLSGKPTKSGVFHVTVTATNAGGYSFVRVIDIAVRNADGTLPQETALANAAEIDFAPLKGLTTGLFCPTGAVVLAVGPKPGTGAAVKKVSLSGLPAGLASAVTLTDEGAEVEVTGMPVKPGRFVVSVSVTYADGKTLKSQAAVVVEDGGSFYLFVTAGDADGGTVSGAGVYAAGETVKLTAKAARKHVFAGWCVPDEEGELSLLSSIREIDGVDPRAATVSFPFRPDDFSGDCEVTGVFADSSEDEAPEILLEGETWEIDPADASSFAFEIQSLSVPKVTVKGLPKGVTADGIRGRLSYEPNAAIVPGVYTASLSAKNATVSKETVVTVEIRVANRVSEAIGGLDPDRDAYQLNVGAAIDPGLIAPVVGSDWKLTVKGLPSGLSFKNGCVTGIPTKTGDYTVTFTATTGTGKSKKTEVATITVHVAELPATLCGTFTGILEDGDGATVGTVTVTATAAGKVTVAVKTAASSVSFTAKTWSALTNGVGSVSMTAKDGTRCDLTVVATDDWRAWQAKGVLSGETTLSFEAQRNPYDKKSGVEEARQLAEEMAGTSKLGGWTLKIKSDGTVTIAGKYEGTKISGSAVLQWDEEDAFARYVHFVGKTETIGLVFEFNDKGKAISWHALQTP